jgi:hypothetical protein
VGLVSDDHPTDKGETECRQSAAESTGPKTTMSSRSSMNTGWSSAPNGSANDSAGLARLLELLALHDPAPGHVKVAIEISRGLLVAGMRPAGPCFR